MYDNFPKESKKSVFVITRSGRTTDTPDRAPLDTHSDTSTPVMHDSNVIPDAVLAPPVHVSVPSSPPRVHFDPALPPDPSSPSPPVSVEEWGGRQVDEGG